MSRNAYGMTEGDRTLTIDERAVYTADEAATILRISVRKLRQIVKTGCLRPQGYCRQHRFFGRDLIAFLDEEGRGRAS